MVDLDQNLRAKVCTGVGVSFLYRDYGVTSVGYRQTEIEVLGMIDWAVEEAVNV